MKNLYLINFLGGTAGNFIRQLLIRMFKSRSNDITFGDNYSAHENIVEYDLPVKHEYWQMHGVEPVYKYFNTPIVSLESYIAVDHLPPNWDELFMLYPTCKNIVITVPITMALRVVGNLFFKTICVSGLKPENNTPWQDIRKNDPILAQYTRPEDIPIELLEVGFRDYARHYNTVIIPPYNNYPIPDQYKDRVCYISYYDIIHDMDKVLNQLKEFTGLELPEGIDRVYKQHQDGQAELVKTKMPWVDDK